MVASRVSEGSGSPKLNVTAFGMPRGDYLVCVVSLYRECGDVDCAKRHTHQGAALVLRRGGADGPPYSVIMAFGTMDRQPLPAITDDELIGLHRFLFDKVLSDKVAGDNNISLKSYSIDEVRSADDEVIRQRVASVLSLSTKDFVQGVEAGKIHGTLVVDDRDMDRG